MMKLEWSQYGNGTWQLRRYPRNEGNLFQWAGKVFVAPDSSWMGQIHRTGEYKTFPTKEEAMVWVEVIVRMEGR
jgi:hypothetical protein